MLGPRDAPVIAATHAVTWRVGTTPAKHSTWATPPAIYMALDAEFRFDMDAAADAGNAKHVHHLTLDVDALAVPWAGSVFCNPPYGRGLGAWCRKAAAEVDAGRASVVVMLLPARTDVSWFHEVVLPRAEVRFIRGRLSYTLGVPRRRGRSPFASMVCVFRPGATVTRPQLLFPFLSREAR